MNANSRKDLQQNNRTRVLTLLRDYGPADVARIAEVAGLNKQTVSKSIGHWRELGVVVPRGKGSATGEAAGKRPTLFGVNPEYKYIFAAQLFETSMVAAIANLNAEVVATDRFVYEKDARLEVILERARRSFDAMSTALKLNDGRFASVVLGTSGITDSREGTIVFSPHFKSWGYQTPVVDMLRRLFPAGYALHVDNWVRYQAYAEMKIGLARQTARFLEIGTEPDGVTSGLVWDGALISGKRGLAGEIGHMPVDLETDVVCSCGGRGCLEPAISLLRLQQRAREMAKNHPESILCVGGGPDGISYKDIFPAADAGDSFARHLLEGVAKYFAAAISHVVQVCDPELIIIQGEYAGAGDFFLEQVRDRVRKTTLPGMDKSVQIHYSRLGGNQGIVGAAHFAADRLYESLERFD